jgi:hypothetical protein
MSEKLLRFILLSTMAVILAAIAAHSLGVSGDNYPTLRSPYPVLLVIPAFLGVPVIVIAILFASAFAAWSNQLLRAEAAIPRRSIVLLFVAILLSGLVFISGWEYGLKYQGMNYLFPALAISALAVVILVVIASLNRRRPMLATSAAFHFLLFAWLATYAMPYLGETP